MLINFFYEFFVLEARSFSNLKGWRLKLKMAQSGIDPRSVYIIEIPYKPLHVVNLPKKIYQTKKRHSELIQCASLSDANIQTLTEAVV